MKKFIVAFLMVLIFPLMVHSAVIPLGFAWDANIEPDMKEYEVYRTDVVPRVSVCKVQHPTTTCLNNSITVPDGSQGTLTFVAVARDTSLNTSGDSNVVSHIFDYQAPLFPKLFRKVSLGETLKSDLLRIIEGDITFIFIV